MTHVAVLMGGWSSEREVSLVTGKACAEGLREAGYAPVTEVDVGRDVGTVLAELKPDAAFNALHGPFGEDGCIQGLLELMGIPYTHSGVRASALAMYKPVARGLFTAAGMACADGGVFRREQVLRQEVMDPPYVVKPLNEGSSVGVHIIMAGDNLHPLAEDWPFGDEVLVERYIPGREIQVAVMGERALGAIEIQPLGQFYDYEAKYTEGKARHLMPAPMLPDMYRAACDMALTAHRVLGCRGVSRADLRYDDTGGEPGRLYILEVNTQPGMTPLSLVPEIAAHEGISFVELVRWMVEDATCGR